MASNGFCERNKMMKSSCCSSSVDRISNLPEELLHIILSSVDMKQIVQMSTLSRQWRYLWKSIATINLDGRMWVEYFEEFCGNNQYYVMKLEQFMGFVTKVLSLRDNSTIKTFNLCCKYAIPDNVTCDESTELVNLMVRYNVEEVCFKEVEVVVSTLQYLSTKIKTLKVIKSNICGDGSNYDPSDPDDELRKLNLRCLTLENLIIDDSYDQLDRISIHGSSLTFLTIKSGTRLGCLLASVDDRELKICAPNLRQLYLRGGFFSDYSLENLCSLDHAQVDTTIRHNDNNINEYAIEVWRLNKLLKGLVHTKSLTLSADAFQGKGSAEIPNMFKDVSSFHSLRYFKLTNWHTSSCIPALVKLFEKFPCMETLVLEKTKGYRQLSTKEEEWGNQFVTRGMFMKLKSVEIKGIEGSGDELKFLEFTLNTALMLENVIMTPSRELSRDGLERMKEFNKKIQHLPRASVANVTIVVKLS